MRTQSKLRQSRVRRVERTYRVVNKRGFFVLVFSKHDMDPDLLCHRCAADNTKRCFRQVNKLTVNF